MSGNNVPSVKAESEELCVINSVLLETFSRCDELKSDLLEYSPNPKKDLQDFKAKLVDLAEMEKQISALVTTVDIVESEIENKMEDVGELNFDGISNIFNSVYVSALKEQEINEEIKKMICSVDVAIHNENSGKNMSGSDDLLVTATKESYLDPLTKLPIQDPVKSKTCHHTYERGPILQHLQKYTRCPYSGCVNNLSRGDLVEDYALKRKLLKIHNASK